MHTYTHIFNAYAPRIPLLSKNIILLSQKHEGYILHMNNTANPFRLCLREHDFIFCM